MKETSSSRERVLAALSHREADRVPIDLGTTNSTGIAKRAYARLLDHLGLAGREVVLSNRMQQLAQVDEDVLDRLGIDTRGIAPHPVHEPELAHRDGADFYADEWGIRWKMPRNGFYFDIVAHPLQDVERVGEVDAHPWPDPEDAGRVRGLREKAHRIRNVQGKAVLLKGIAPGVMELAAWLRGYEQLFLDFYLNPGIAHAILEKSMEMKIRFWDMALKELGDVVDVVNESDDLGSQSGPLISLELYREFIRPRHRRLVDAVRRRTGARLFLHSCGSIRPFIPDLIDVGFDILNPVQFCAADMDAKALKREFGKDVTFWGGGIDTQEVLPHGTPERIRDSVRRQIEDLSEGGGFIFSQVHNIQADVPPESIMAMYEAFHAFSGYGDRRRD